MKFILLTLINLLCLQTVQAQNSLTSKDGLLTQPTVFELPKLSIEFEAPSGLIYNVSGTQISINEDSTIVQVEGGISNVDEEDYCMTVLLSTTDMNFLCGFLISEKTKQGLSAEGFKELENIGLAKQIEIGANKRIGNIYKIIETNVSTFALQFDVDEYTCFYYFNWSKKSDVSDIVDFVLKNIKIEGRSVFDTETLEWTLKNDDKLSLGMFSNLPTINLPSPNLEDAFEVQLGGVKGYLPKPMQVYTYQPEAGEPEILTESVLRDGVSSDFTIQSESEDKTSRFYVSISDEPGLTDFISLFEMTNKWLETKFFVTFIEKGLARSNYITWCISVQKDKELYIGKAFTILNEVSIEFIITEKTVDAVHQKLAYATSFTPQK